MVELYRNNAQCVQCGEYLRPRYSADGSPLRSNSLNGMDKFSFFCTLRCAARFGVQAALRDPGRYMRPERLALCEENKRRYQLMLDHMKGESHA